MSKIDVRKITSPDGAIRYIKDGKLHNSDGPAVVYPDGKEEYYINGFQFTKDEFKKRKKEGVGLPFYKTSSGKMRH